MAAGWESQRGGWESNVGEKQSNEQQEDGIVDVFIEAMMEVKRQARRSAIRGSRGLFAFSTPPEQGLHPAPSHAR